MNRMNESLRAQAEPVHSLSSLGRRIRNVTPSFPFGTHSPGVAKPVHLYAEASFAVLTLPSPPGLGRGTLRDVFSVPFAVVPSLLPCGVLLLLLYVL